MRFSPPSCKDTPARKRNFQRLARPVIQTLETRQFLSATIPAGLTASPLAVLSPDASVSTVTGLTPAEIRHAYGLDLVSFSSGKVAANGSGETIAIVDAYNDPNISADLKTFDSEFSLANPTLSVVNETGGSTLPTSNASWGEEISLDVEWAHAIAPAAKILLVETSSSGYSDLLAGVTYARSVSGVAAVSMSWGGSEFSGETSYDSDFTTPSGHTGVTFVSASGDDGSSGGADWPAASPEVLSVGGTTLTTTGNTGTYSSETGWVDSGGGVSRYEGTPEYQSAAQADGARTVPDVSYDANPSTGFAVYDSYGTSGWTEFGGTSDAAPQWAGIIAIADQGRAISKLAALDGSTNTLPTLYSLYTKSDATDFHDVTAGATSRSISAETGYDLVTGIGTPKANALIPALVSSTITTKLTLTGSGVRGGGGGGRGGPFDRTVSAAIPDTAEQVTIATAAAPFKAAANLPVFSTHEIMTANASWMTASGLSDNATLSTVGDIVTATISDALMTPPPFSLGIPTETPLASTGIVNAIVAAPSITSNVVIVPSVTHSLPMLRSVDLGAAARSFVATLSRDPVTWRSATAAGFVAAAVYFFNANAERKEKQQQGRRIFCQAEIAPAVH